jgi:hypothetical protein
VCHGVPWGRHEQNGRRLPVEFNLNPGWIQLESVVIAAQTSHCAGLGAGL